MIILLVFLGFWDFYYSSTVDQTAPPLQWKAKLQSSDSSNAAV